MGSALFGRSKKKRERQIFPQRIFKNPLVVALSDVRRKGMKKKKAALILAALIAMTTVSAQAAITPEEQEQIVTAVLEKLENEKKTPHYVSVSSTEKGADSNVMNDGALAKNSIAIGPSMKTEGKDNIVIGSGEIEGQKGVTSVNGDRVVVVGHGNYFQPVSDRNGKPVSYRDSAIIGHNNKLLQGDEHDAGGGTPAYQIIHGWKNTLKGSFTGAIGYENEIKNSSRPGHTSQSMAFAVGTENTIDATGYYMGEKTGSIRSRITKNPGRIRMSSVLIYMWSDGIISSARPREGNGM